MVGAIASLSLTITSSGCGYGDDHFIRTQSAVWIVCGLQATTVMYFWVRFAKQLYKTKDGMAMPNFAHITIALRCKIIVCNTSGKVSILTYRWFNTQQHYSCVVNEIFTLAVHGLRFCVRSRTYYKYSSKKGVGLSISQKASLFTRHLWVN